MSLTLMICISSSSLNIHSVVIKWVVLESAEHFQSKCCGLTPELTVFEKAQRSNAPVSDWRNHFRKDYFGYLSVSLHWAVASTQNYASYKDKTLIRNINQHPLLWERTSSDQRFTFNTAWDSQHITVGYSNNKWSNIFGLKKSTDFSKPLNCKGLKIRKYKCRTQVISEPIFKCNWKLTLLTIVYSLMIKVN